MLSSYHIRVGLFISCAIFLVTFLSFVQRLRVHNDFIRRKRIIINSYTDHNPSYLQLKDKRILQYDEKLLRENVLGTDRTHLSVFDRFHFINPSKFVCNCANDTNKFMIIIVLSRTINIDYRNAIRATWGRIEKYKHHRTQFQTVFFVGTDDTSQAGMKLEQEMFNDVIQIGIPETYSFVAHKELASLFWTRLYCPQAQIIFRADDDILLDIFLLLNYIENHLDFHNKDGLYGWFRYNNVVHRADKWAVTKMEYESMRYPPYTFGIGYLFSNLSCQRLVAAANQPNHQIIRIGDAYITGILRELANVSFYDFQNLDYAYTFYNPIACDEQFAKNPKLLICMSKLHIGTRDDLFEFYETFDIILARYNKSLADF